MDVLTNKEIRQKTQDLEKKLNEYRRKQSGEKYFYIHVYPTKPSDVTCRIEFNQGNSTLQGYVALKENAVRQIDRMIHNHRDMCDDRGVLIPDQIKKFSEIDQDE